MLCEEAIKKVQIICPFCGVKDIITLPSKIIQISSHLTTISIPKGKICEHHFQIFIDKAFNVRGYQKVDFEVEGEKKSFNINKTGFINGLEVYHKSIRQNKPIKSIKHLSSDNEENLILSKIYEEFWEFIDDDNKEFQKFIMKDNRRRQILHMIDDVKNYKSKFAKLAQKAN